MLDFLMVGWEQDYSRNKVLVNKHEHLYKQVVITKENIFKRSYKIFFKTMYGLIRYKTKCVYIPAFNQSHAPIVILLSKFFRKKVILDILVSDYDTFVQDRKLVSPKSIRAKKAYWFDNFCIKYSDYLICDTELHKTFFIDTFNGQEEKFKVIPVGADENFFEKFSPINTDPNELKVLFYGGFSPLHGIDKIIYAAELLKGENITFTLVGDGQTRKSIENLVGKLELKNIKFIDYINYNHLPEFISHFDVGLGIFGDTEKAHRVVPNKVYQLAACGKPIITLRTRRTCFWSMTTKS